VRDELYTFTFFTGFFVAAVDVVVVLVFLDAAAVVLGTRTPDVEAAAAVLLGAVVRRQTGADVDALHAPPLHPTAGFLVVVAGFLAQAVARRRPGQQVPDDDGQMSAGPPVRRGLADVDEAVDLRGAVAAAARDVDVLVVVARRLGATPTSHAAIPPQSKYNSK